MNQTQTAICVHCGRICGDYKGGSASVDGHPVCHPNATDRPDCYRLVTVYGQRLGMLNRPKPGGCTVRWVEGDRLVPCRNKAVIEEPYTDPGCPDDPGDGPHKGALRYCPEHRHLSSSSGSSRDR